MGLCYMNPNRPYFQYQVAQRILRVSKTLLVRVSLAATVVTIVRWVVISGRTTYLWFGFRFVGRCFIIVLVIGGTVVKKSRADWVHEVGWSCGLFGLLVKVAYATLNNIVLSQLQSSVPIRICGWGKFGERSWGM